VPAGEELWKLFLVIALNKIRAKGVYHRAAKRDVRLTAGERFLAQYSKSEQEGDNTACVFLQMVINETLDQLPAQQKQMVILRIEGFEVMEIADKVGRSKRSVERVLQEFRKKLASVLQEDA
jgi:RNA polymerase sigma factor (sigma-70 family)